MNGNNSSNPDKKVPTTSMAVSTQKLPLPGGNKSVPQTPTPSPSRPIMSMLPMQKQIHGGSAMDTEQKSKTGAERFIRVDSELAAERGVVVHRHDGNGQFKAGLIVPPLIPSTQQEIIADAIRKEIASTENQRAPTEKWGHSKRKGRYSLSYSNSRSKERSIERQIDTVSEDRETVMHAKRWYVSQQLALANGVAASQALNNIPVGATYNNRVGLQVRLHKIIIRGWVYMTHNSATFSATNGDPPILKLIFARTFVPIAAGTPEPMINTDANPPGNSVVPYSSLGVVYNTAPDILRCLVKNPPSVGLYKIYRSEMFPQATIDKRSNANSTYTNPFTLSTGTTYGVQPKVYEFKWVIPLDCVSTYLSNGGNNVYTNLVQMYYLPIFDDAHQLMQFSYTSELIFEDINTS